MTVTIPTTSSAPTEQPTTLMTAVRQRRYGTPAERLTVEQVEVPRAATGEVLVRIEAASVNPADWHRITGEPMIMRLSEGLRAPNRPIPGSDAAGTIVALGDDVVDRAVGDRVLVSRGGAFAEYLALPAAATVPIASTTSAVEAAGLPIAGVTAWQAVVEHGAVQPGQRVVVNGASGGVGHYAVQLAHELGAHVTAVCSGRNADTVISLGADVVVDYTTTDPATAIDGADLVIDLVGLRAPDAAAMLHDDGVWMVLGMPKDGRIARPMLRVGWAALRFAFRKPSFSWFVAEETPERLAALVERLEDGRLTTVVDRELPLARVHDAFEHLQTGRTVGKIVLVP